MSDWTPFLDEQVDHARPYVKNGNTDRLMMELTHIAGVWLEDPDVSISKPYVWSPVFWGVFSEKSIEETKACLREQAKQWATLEAKRRIGRVLSDAKRMRRELGSL